MDRSPVFLQQFQSIPAEHRGDQSSILDWLGEAHGLAEVTRQRPETEEEAEGLVRRYSKLVHRFGCSTDRIQFRNSALGDFTHRDWDGMRIFNLKESPSGRPCGDRSRFFREVSGEALQRFYFDDPIPPAVLIHVTCTGYVSPSAAQRLVADRGWGRTTEVVHAYHMGCYASLPAVRMAAGFLARGKPTVDLVHTELCTLHMDPTQHAPEQLVVQTLFSDGLIRYRAAVDGGGLELVATREEIVPGTESEMSWMVSDFGMKMTLSRKVPEHIRGYLPGFLDRLAEEGGTRAEILQREARFAIHPGGPRIIDEIAEHLGLDASQVAASNEVLANYGNMSSATLPHVWMAILEDLEVSPGAWVVSLAFGPGLTVAGALFRKRSE